MRTKHFTATGCFDMTIINGEWYDVFPDNPKQNRSGSLADIPPERVPLPNDLADHVFLHQLKQRNSRIL